MALFKIVAPEVVRISYVLICTNVSCMCFERKSGQDFYSGLDGRGV